MEGALDLRKDFPLSSVMSVYVTNVHNVPSLRFFGIVENAANLQFLEDLRKVTKSPYGHRCLRLPREGTIFGLRLAGNVSVLRAVRPATVCFTAQNDILLPDLGRKEKLDEKDPRYNMFHLPIDLRKPGSMAFCFQLQGINDDVTIVPEMLRAVMSGLLFQSLKLRIDGYSGMVLKVQLLDVNLEKLKNWQSSIETEKKNSFDFSLDDYKMAVKKLSDDIEHDQGKQVARNLLKDYDKAENEGVTKEVAAVFEKPADTVLPWRPILGAIIKRSFVKRPILGCSPVCKSPNFCAIQSNYSAWKQDSQAFITIVDKRTQPYYCVKNAILVITPTYVGQLERFFGVIHEPGKRYLQHMWIDEDIDWETRYIHGNRPLLFDIVLAKHAIDQNWYRAKVIEVLQDKEHVRVFFVDYGGECFVNLKNVARLSKKIGNMPFQATLFRLHGVCDATATEVEHSLAVSIMRRMLLKKTLLVHIVKFEANQLIISFNEAPNVRIIETLMGKGFLNAVITNDNCY